MTTRSEPRYKTLDAWLAWQQTLHPRKIDLGLERVRRVFTSLHPGYQPPLTITVGGTNGKGSCIAMLEAILRAEGIHCGSYTSPHILRYNERIRIAGQPLPDEAICDAFQRIDLVRAGSTLSFFEFGTLAALDLFSQARVDVQLLEVGLGGRLDAVNIVDADVALITSIDIDHKGWLGETREAIGVEKAGILRRGRPAVIGDRNPPSSLIKHAGKLETLLLRLGEDFDVRRRAGGFDWVSSSRYFEALPLPALQGRQQMDNAATVIAALLQLKDKLSVTETSIRQGLESICLAGRYHSMPGRPEILLDVAHNPQAVGLLADFIRANYPGRQVSALFTVMADKDVEGMLEKMGTVVDVWALAPLPDNPRCASEQRILQAFDKLGMTPPLAGFSDWRSALAALKNHTTEEGLVIIFGSFFLIAEFLAEHGS